MEGERVRRQANLARREAQQNYEEELNELNRSLNHKTNKLQQEMEAEMKAIEAKFAAREAHSRQEMKREAAVARLQYLKTMQSIADGCSQACPQLGPAFVGLTAIDSILEMIWPPERVLLALKVCKAIRRRILALCASPSLMVHLEVLKSDASHSSSISSRSIQKDLQRFGFGNMQLRMTGRAMQVLIAQALASCAKDFNSRWNGAKSIVIAPNRDWGEYDPYDPLIINHVDMEYIIRGSPSLDTLSVRNCEVCYTPLPNGRFACPFTYALLNCRKLQKMELVNVGPVRLGLSEMTPKVLAPLTTLALSGTCGEPHEWKLASELVKVLSQFTTLTSLDLSNNYIVYRDLQILSPGFANSTNLTLLDLSCNCINTDGAWWLHGCLSPLKLLRVLRVEKNPIKSLGWGEVARALMSCPELQEFGVDDTILDSTTFLSEILPSLKHLRRVALFQAVGSWPCPLQVIKFFHLLSSTPIRELDYSQATFSIQMAGPIAEGLSLSTQLVSLNLLMKPDAFEELSMAIAHLESLESLDISNSFSFDTGWASFALALNHLSLRRLTMGRCIISREDWLTLAGSLPQSLTYLNLENNEYDDALLECLEPCLALRHVCLRRMGLRDAHLERLCGVLMKLRHLEVIDLGCNMFGSECAPLLGNIFLRCDFPSGLQKIFLEHNPIPAKEREKLRSMDPRCMVFF